VFEFPSLFRKIAGESVEDAPRVIAGFFASPPVAETSLFIGELIRVHGFRWDGERADRIARVLLADETCDEYATVVLECASLSGAFAKDVGTAALAILGQSDSSQAALARALKLILHDPDREDKQEHVIEIVMIVVERFEWRTTLERDPVIDVLNDLFASSDFEDSNGWGQMLFAEIITVQELTCPSAREFVGLYAQADETVVEDNVRWLGEALRSEPEKFRYAVSFLVVLFEAVPSARALFLAEFALTPHQIDAWPADLSPHLPLFCPNSSLAF
jgi:hypothetical protein